ncbi:MAG: sugar transferase [Eubacterium sp.]|nr:sugar transferase [Eubacterium sp.]
MGDDVLKKIYKVIKRIIGFFAAIVAFILLSPVMLITAICIKVESKGPILFKQDRIGKNGKVYKIYKFRSMCMNAENMGTGVYSNKGDSRVTKVGRIIRATSIDELPQLVNIIKGEMAFIGPRPPLTYHPWEFSEYTEEQKRMFEVLPGITGWAQVHGRKDVEWHERIKLNVWYVDHISFLLDAKIFFMTIYKVLINADNENIGETLKKDNGEENGTETNVHNQ